MAGTEAAAQVPAGREGGRAVLGAETGVGRGAELPLPLPTPGGATGAALPTFAALAEFAALAARRPSEFPVPSRAAVFLPLPEVDALADAKAEARAAAVFTVWSRETTSPSVKPLTTSACE